MHVSAHSARRQRVCEWLITTAVICVTACGWHHSPSGNRQVLVLDIHQNLVANTRMLKSATARGHASGSAESLSARSWRAPGGGWRPAEQEDPRPPRTARFQAILAGHPQRERRTRQKQTRARGAERERARAHARARRRRGDTLLLPAAAADGTCVVVVGGGRCPAWCHCPPPPPRETPRPPCPPDPQPPDFRPKCLCNHLPPDQEHRERGRRRRNSPEPRGRRADSAPWCAVWLWTTRRTGKEADSVPPLPPPPPPPLHSRPPFVCG